MSGFSDDVAMAVTHPLWPSNDPKNLSCSDIFAAAQCPAPSRRRRPIPSKDDLIPSLNCTVALRSLPAPGDLTGRGR